MSRPDARGLHDPPQRHHRHIDASAPPRARGNDIACNGINVQGSTMEHEGVRLARTRDHSSRTAVRLEGAPVTNTSSSAYDKLDTSVAHSARLWNHLLGGKDNFAADREAAEQVLAFMPELVQSARFNRQFLGRAVRYLADEVGIRQFLDIGTGLPTADNTHEVAQSAAPDSRIVYVDNDPMVLAHARALLTSSPQGATDYIDADIRDIERIITEARRTLNFDQPIAIMLLGILNFVVDDAEAARIVHQLLDAVPAGSHLVISHPTREVNPEAVDRAVQMWNAGGSAPMTIRSPAQITDLFAGLQLIDPGLVTCSRWRPNGNDTTPASEYCAVARKNN
ncbi:SAM-dependent methyltransferase [Micromonospora arida]|uniref:SAM-dependent methyltransferase n=1 Tax=Micromonospora arida TaxID=2203715 RepID=UPI0033E8BC3F